VAASQIARWIATCGGLGYAPVAPGTITSLAVALLVWLLAPAEVWLLGGVLVVGAIGIWASGREETRLGLHDPRTIVVDEVAGMLVALVGHPRNVLWVLGLFLLPALLTPLVLPLYLVLGIPMELLPLPFTLRILKGLSGFLPDSGVNEEPGTAPWAGRGSGLKLFVLLMGISIIFFGKQFFPAVTTFFSAIRGSVTQVTSLFKKKKGVKRPVGRPKKEDGEPRGPGRPKMIKPAAVEGIPPQLLSYIFGR